MSKQGFISDSFCFGLEFLEKITKHVIDNHAGKRSALSTSENSVKNHKSCIADILKNHDEHNIKLWRDELMKLVKENPEIMELITQIDGLEHHIGDHYLKQGMKIKRYNEEMKNIISIMNFIKSLSEDHENEKTKTAILGKNQEETSGKGKGSSLLEHKGVYNAGENAQIRSLEEALLPEESAVRAIAVSILAETNGNSEIAKEILSISGLKMLKSMDPKALVHLQEDLQAISSMVSHENNH
jgi:hypothetical protein